MTFAVFLQKEIRTHTLAKDFFFYSKYIGIVSSQLYSHLPNKQASKQLVQAESQCVVHVALPKQLINQFKLVQQSRQQELRVYFPNMYIPRIFQQLISTLLMSEIQPHAISQLKDTPWLTKGVTIQKNTYRIKKIPSFM